MFKRNKIRIQWVVTNNHPGVYGIYGPFKSEAAAIHFRDKWLSHMPKMQALPITAPMINPKYGYWGD